MRAIPITTPMRAHFIPHSGWSNTVPTIDRFAERMVEHGDLERAAAECGISNDYAKNLWGLICKEVGEK